MDQWALDYQNDINTAIARFLQDHYSNNLGQNEATLREAVIYSMSFWQDSRIHTILSMVAYEEFLGITADSVIDILIGIEFIHTGLMLHEDAAGVHNIYIQEGIPTIKKYGESLSIIVWDILIELGIDRLSQSGNMQIIREVISSTGDTGLLRGVARDILTDHASISEKEYLTMYDEKLSRSIIAAFLIGSMLAWDTSQLLKDQFRQFGTFLARIYQVGHDIDQHEQSLNTPNSEVNRERGVVDFVGYEKAKGLYEELYVELMKMTGGFQNSKFQDIITIFKDRTVSDI
jgi:geranylgeranyl pyrophosphate synthase